MVTLALSAALLAVHFGSCAMEGRSLRACDTAAWWLLPFLAYSLINVVGVTPVRWLGWLDWLGWANAVAVFWVVRNGITARGPRRLLFGVLIGLGFFGVVLACHQRFVDREWLMLGRRQAEQFFGRASGSFGIPNSFAGFLLLLLPAAAALTIRRGARETQRVWWGWVTLVFGVGLLLTVSRGGWLALAAAFIIWPFMASGWRWQRRTMTAVVVLGGVVAVSALVYRAADSVRDRFDRLFATGEASRPVLWRAAWEIFQSAPWWGSGAGSFNVRFEQHRPRGFIDEPQWVHNEYLNTLSDYGAVGLLLLLGGVVVIVARPRASNAGLAQGADELASPFVRHGMSIGLTAFALQLMLDFHLKIPALAMSVAAMGALAFGRPAGLPQARSSPQPARVAWIGLAAGTLAAMFPILRLYRAEALRYEAREELDRAVVADRTATMAVAAASEEKLRQATKLAPANAAAWADLGFALELQAFADPERVGALADRAAAAAGRAVDLAPVVPEFWMRLGVARGMQGQRPEATTAFENAVKLAPRNPRVWYYYAHHLSRDTKQREDALRAIATCLSLDPGNAAAEALRVKLDQLRVGPPFIP